MAAGGWQDALIEVYRGKCSPASALEAAVHVRKDIKRRRLTQIHFHLGALAQLQGDEIRARQHYQAAIAFGATRRQRLLEIQLPLALPTIMAGINQTIMMALAMVVIASMIGVKGLGQPVLKAITNQYFTMGLLNGLAIVVIAIVFDRVSQAYAKRSQKHLKGMYGA